MPIGLWKARFENTIRMPIKTKYYILLFLPFFLLFYSESIEIGGMRVSQLWKIPLLGYFIFYLFQYRWKKSPAWSQAYYWLSLKHLVNSGSWKYLMSNIQDGISFLFLPLVFNYVQNAFKKQTISRLLLCISQYFVLTNIPFLFFGLQPHKQGLSYGDMTAYTGIFQNQHAMSTIMGICIIILLYFFKKGTFDSWKTKIYNVFLLALASYAMYLGFARTGWAMCLIGVYVLFLPRNKRVKQWLASLTVVGVLVGGFVFMMATNEDFHNRVLDINTTTGKQKVAGSGRAEFIGYALELYASGNPFELAFGKSMKDLTAYEYEKTGHYIYAHNGFATLLVTDGAIGVGIKLIAMLLLLAFIHRRRACFSHNAALAFWVMNLSYQLTQGGHVFHSDILYAMMFGLLQMEYEEMNSEETNIEETQQRLNRY